MRAIKISPVRWDNASRDQRELSVLENDFNIECFVMAKGDANDKGRASNIVGYKTFLYSTKPLGGASYLIPLNKILSVFLWAYHVKQYHADILTCHDIPALLIGWISTWFTLKENVPKLIYDSHEFEIEKNANRNRFSKWLVKYLERFLMKRCAFSIMVNDSIADEVQHIHKLETRPVVVRSTPEYWKIDKSVIEQKRRELCETLGISEDTFIIMYHGGLLPNRGIETVIELVARNSNIAAIILGNGDETYESSLKALVADRGVKDFVLFHPAVSIDVLWQYVGAANVGMVILKNVCTNHYYSLPNKFFENIQSLTPIIGSNFPEISRIIDEYKIGLTCDPANIEMLNNCVEKMRCDKAFYDMCKEHLIVAKNDLCWENEKEQLITAYKEIIDS